MSPCFSRFDASILYVLHADFNTYAIGHVKKYEDLCKSL
jgi:hypothetical protein